MQGKFCRRGYRFYTVMFLRKQNSAIILQSLCHHSLSRRIRYGVFNVYATLSSTRCLWSLAPARGIMQQQQLSSAVRLDLSVARYSRFIILVMTTTIEHLPCWRRCSSADCNYVAMITSIIVNYGSDSTKKCYELYVRHEQ